MNSLPEYVKVKGLSDFIKDKSQNFRANLFGLGFILILLLAILTMIFNPDYLSDHNNSSLNDYSSDYSSTYYGSYGSGSSLSVSYHVSSSLTDFFDILSLSLIDIWLSYTGSIAFFSAVLAAVSFKRSKRKWNNMNDFFAEYVEFSLDNRILRRGCYHVEVVGYDGLFIGDHKDEVLEYIEAFAEENRI